MKYINQLLLLLIVSLISVFSYLGVSGTWTNIFTAPLIIIVGFIAFYLYKQFTMEEEIRKQKMIKLTLEDKQAEKWLTENFYPQAIVFGKNNRKTLIIYFSIFIVGIYFLWHFISYGLNSAIFNTLTASIFLILFMIYIFAMSHATKKLTEKIPLNMRKLVSSEWIRAYIYLLPVGFIAHLAYPIESTLTNLNTKLLSSHLFILIYTFLFLGAYCIFYLYNEIKNEEEAGTKKEV